MRLPFSIPISIPISVPIRQEALGAVFTAGRTAFKPYRCSTQLSTQMGSLRRRVAEQAGASSSGSISRME